MQKIISIKNGVTRMPEWRMAEPVNFEACDGEHIAIVGPNGGGKSMFVDIIVGRHPLLMHDPDYDFSPSQKTMVSDNIKYITFRDTYGGDNDRTYFLQQRWNQLEIDENTPIVKDKLEEAYQMAGEDTPERRALQQHIYELFHMQHLMDKYTILLSSGELRKFKLASTLFSEPRVLIMDNPFIGLDAETRDQLKELLKTLSSERALQIILVLSKSDDIPDFITHVVEVKNMKVLPKVTLAEYLAGRESVPACAEPGAGTGHRRPALQRPRISHPGSGEDEQGAHTVWRANHPQRPRLDRDERRAMGFERTERSRKEYTSQSGLCRQSAELCLRHYPLRQSSRQRRKHLGHQETHRLRIA